VAAADWLAPHFGQKDAVPISDPQALQNGMRNTSQGHEFAGEGSRAAKRVQWDFRKGAEGIGDQAYYRFEVILKLAAGTGEAYARRWKRPVSDWSWLWRIYTVLEQVKVRLAENIRRPSDGKTELL
jgi:hypothetical protein